MGFRVFAGRYTYHQFRHNNNTSAPFNYTRETDCLPLRVTAGLATSPARVTHDDTRSLGDLDPPTVDHNI